MEGKGTGGVGEKEEGKWIEEGLEGK